MNIHSWLDSIQLQPLTDVGLQQLQWPTPMPSIGADLNASTPFPNKRRRPENDNNTNDINDIDLDPMPRGRATLSNSDRISHYSSGTPSTSPTKRLMQLEIAPVNPLLVAQFSRNDTRIPAELEKMLDDLEDFDSRVGIVPDYLALEIEARAKHNRELRKFRPSRFYQTSETILNTNPKLCLNRVLEVFSEAMECFNEEQSEAAWNALVHWPVVRLALGPMTGSAEVAANTRTQSQTYQVHVGAMPCTTARLQSRQHGAVDYCFFIDPSKDDAQQINKIREAREYINHTDYHPLRQRPIVLSAKSIEPSGSYKDAQRQLGVWQAAQWALLEDLLQSSATQSALIPFLPALIIQGHEWSFASTTKSGRHTILWVGQTIGRTNSVLGIFQIIHALRHIAAWIRDTYWPWYRRAILLIPENKKAVRD